MIGWIRVCSTAELLPGEFQLAYDGDTAIAVFNIDGAFYAIEDVCTHDGGELAGGPIEGFLVEGAHAHDLATLLDLEGYAVRSGHHCAHPLMAYLGVPATCRASLAFYNTFEEIDGFVAALRKVRRMLG
jgi:cysteine desulfurase/selenocysteine lyase